MRDTLIILFVLTTSFANSQTTKGNVYNFQTDYYWDSTLYKSTMAFNYELKNGKVHQSNYPVKIFQYSEVVTDSPLITKPVYETDNFKYEPYSYRKNKDSIFLIFFDYSKNMYSSHLNYLLNINDSVNLLLDKSSLIDKQSTNGISVKGRSKYIGIRTVSVSGKPRQTYCFEENDKSLTTDLRYYFVTEVYIDTMTLVPVQFISRRFKKNDNYTNYFSVTKVHSVTTTIPKYTFQKELTLYEDSSLRWTQKQREAFLKEYTRDTKSKKYITCLLEILDGQISFYDFDSKPLFKTIVTNNSCNEVIPKN